ncbi:hypothetical protein PQ465_13140 [Sphingobacterium oryzagri]|uniref:Uncharacterized protein n=1 Tax=Sphingobacterium oryzagri TaxID=3025669 RepID=A0ABY7WC67_9SPHI|nr:hypothetical protein [Sphingobacterium sp. KACC 22765]WDF67248.1 hypothetical protein PQ465_13140 [Sphingobacterium sp. KACC 22765]
MLYTAKAKPAGSAILWSLAFAVCWFLYMIFILPGALTITDPCSATPGINYTWLWLVLALYLAIFGMWIYRSLRKEVNIRKIAFAIVLLLFLLPLAIAMLTASILYEYEHFFSNLSEPISDFLYQQGCYQALEVRENALFILTASVIWPAYYLVKLKIGKRVQY